MTGTTDDYHAPKLVRLPSRGNVWYVVVTKPVSLRKRPNDKQARRSTKTTDFKEAQKRLHRIAGEIYAEFGNPLRDEMEAMSSFVIGADMRGTVTEKEVSDPVVRRQWLQWMEDQATEVEMRPVDEDDGGEDAYVARMITQKIKPRLASLRAETYQGLTAPEGKTVGDALAAYIDGRSWNRIKVKEQAKVYIGRFVELVGDIPLADLTKRHAYQFAEFLAHKEGYANKTVGTHLSCVTAMLKWCERRGWMASQPFSGLDLRGYGAKSEKWKIFEKDMLMHLFALPLQDQERLLFSILITTGMRLDEAALLRWEDVKQQDGITFFDLRESIVKTDGSQRMVPVPDSLSLPPTGKGRMFNYRLDKDGKAQNAASRALMREVRKVTQDKKIVAHSMRGTLKTFLRDAGVSKEVNDFITGHSQGDVAGRYGEGPALPFRLAAVNCVDHPWLRIVPAPYTGRRVPRAA